MDKFGSAFSQAKSYAEKGRSQITTQFDKIDKAVPIGHHAQQRPRAGSSASAAAASPSLAASSTSSAASRPPPPPIRNASSSVGGGVGVTPPVTRTRTPSTTVNHGGGGGVFTAMLHDSAEKEAFFTLLDEYFAARPEFKALFSSSSSSPAPLAPAASRPIPPPPVAPAPAPVASNGLGTATALYDFEGAQAEDLPFSTGDIITLTEIVSDDWLRGELHGRSGIFPASYVQRSS